MTELVKQSDLSKNKSSITTQYLTFLMGKDEFAVDILSVQEIHGWVEPRPMPDTPDYIKGVIDWRGFIVPIVDLRIRFKYQSITYNKTTVVIILKTEIDQDNQSGIIGIVVDAVSDVYDISNNVIMPAPNMGIKVDIEYIKGIAKIANSMIVILKVGKLIAIDALN